jgi:hypothetical protein
MKLFIHSVILYIKHLGPLLLSHVHYLFRILFSYYSNVSIGETSYCACYNPKCGERGCVETDKRCVRVTFNAAQEQIKLVINGQVG